MTADSMGPLPPRQNHPYDAPDPAALISAVRSYLKDDLLPRTDGADRWILRVAAHALAIAEREIRMGPEHRPAHQARLAEVGASDDAALSEMIRDGAFDDRIGELAAHLSESVFDSLSVANPSYALGNEEPSI